MDWDEYGWVMRSQQRQEIVLLLTRPMTPSQIAEELDAHIAQVSHSLSEFKDRGLVEVLNEDARKGRLYRLTEKGVEIRKELEG